MADSATSNSLSALPSKDSPDISLEVATPEEDLALQHSNSLTFKGALPTVEAYLRREDHLHNQELMKDHVIPWALVYTPQGAAKRQILCGLETLKKKALVAMKGNVDESYAFCVASVFTAPEMRNRGFAGRMIAELEKKIRGRQMGLDEDKQAPFSVLFSDIGKEFYRAHGWQPFPSAHINIHAASTSHDGLPRARRIQTEDLPELCALDEKVTRNRISKMSNNGRTAVAFVPDYITMRWHHSKEEFVGKEVFDKVPEIKGAIVGEPGSRVWCYWQKAWANPARAAPHTLHILRLAIEDESFSDFAPASPDDVAKVKNSSTVKAIAAVFAAAQAEAAEWGMQEVSLWNPTSTTLAAAQMVEPNAAVVDREKESITSLLWFGEGPWEDVDWICNEKYGWC